MLVDDHPLMRRGISQLLSFEDEFEVIAEASNGTEAVALAHEEEPDLILLDLNMKGMSGLGGNLRAPPWIRRSKNSDSIFCFETSPFPSYLKSGLFIASRIDP